MTGNAAFNLDISNDIGGEVVSRSDRIGVLPGGMPSGVIITFIRGTSVAYVGVGGGVYCRDFLDQECYSDQLETCVLRGGRVKTRHLNRKVILICVMVLLATGSLTGATEKDMVQVQGVVMTVDLKKHSMVVNERLCVEQQTHQ
jgi:hypothetical protein